MARRDDPQQMTAAELAICEAYRQIETMPDDHRLTEALRVLQTARDLIADYVDQVPDDVPETAAEPTAEPVTAPATAP